MSTKRYRDYFNIDPDYFPQATEELINQGKVDWKKFYPHETFIKLLKDAISVLTRQQKLCLWVEGSYGTGKSHAVLTLKKILEASEEETRAYFEKYRFLSNDLLNKLQGVKNQGKVLSVHRYGSAIINNDHDLIFAIQDSIQKTLKEYGLENTGKASLKDSVVAWLLDEDNKNYFNALIKNKHKNEFENENVDSIIEKLNTYSDAGLISLMDKIFAVANKAQINALKLDMYGLIEWIKSIIKENNLKAIMFIWDEFEAYLQNNRSDLTGFQQLAEVSATNPFYLCIVTHKSAALFDNTDKDQRKILDRFVSPICHIELPENMAFRLMGQALEKKNDEIIQKDWDEAASYLNGSLNNSRKRVADLAKITEKELMGVLPIHPYTALLLKHISSTFDSNQRSMFDFIKNDRGDDVKAFQWFIDNYGPDDDDPLLTIDMLWDFFYEKGKENLSPNIRTILDSYHRQNVSNLLSEEKKVFKTILMLQAISQKVGDSVELFIPNEQNLSHAYEGSQLDNGRAASIANKLSKDQFLYKKPLGQNKNQFSAVLNVGDSAAIEKIKEDLRKSKSTRDLVNEGNISGAIGLSGALNLRYAIEFGTVDNFKLKINELRSKESQLGNKILAVVTFAKNDEESASIIKSIKEAVNDGSYNMLFIDASITPFGADGLNQYLENTAYSDYYASKDYGLSGQFGSMAKEILKKWKERIAAGSFVMYSQDQPNGERLNSIEELISELSKINRDKYPLGIEQLKVIETMYDANSLKLGVESGAKQETSGTYKSANPATKLENAFASAWNIDKYWEKKEVQNDLIVKIKLAIDEQVRKEFESEEGRISISKIYNMLKVEPYGFLPCNLTAFTLGFLLKEYANDNYRWTNDQRSESMSISKLKDMIDEIIKLQVTPDSKYKDQYIVAMTVEEKKFSEVTSQVFNIPLDQCGSVQQTRDLICVEMKKLSFPIWCIKYILEEKSLASSKNLLEELIDCYSGIANTNNFTSHQSEASIALKIGKICIENNSVVDDLIELASKDNCTEGMKKYIQKYKGGELHKIAVEIGAENEYLGDVKSKFDAEASNWLWNIETAKQILDEIIIEYKIIAESNKINSKTSSFKKMIQEWCNKLDFVKIAYDTVKPHVDDIKPLLEILVNIKRTGSLADSQKEVFLDLLQLKSQTFKDFFNNQKLVFKESCSIYVEDLSDAEVDEVMHNIPHSVFTKNGNEYLGLIKGIVEDYKKNQDKQKLKQLWFDRTGSISPREWSKQYKTPILSLVPINEIQTARSAFAAINRKNPDKEDIQKAMVYLESATFFSKLESPEERDKYFKETVIKNYSIMLPDTNEVRSYLDGRVSSEPYDWFSDIEVDNKIKEFAESKYNVSGSDMALTIIEKMDEAKVKEYLKRLIKDNMIVGIEIIKGN